MELAVTPPGGKAAGNGHPGSPNARQRGPPFLQGTDFFAQLILQSHTDPPAPSGFFDLHRQETHMQ